jgi:signal transduction histidine kinase
VLEALTNAGKHAAGSTVNVTLSSKGDELVLHVADNGAGFDTATVKRSHGFDNMRDRLAVVGGELEITSTVDAGTTVTATVPRLA